MDNDEQNLTNELIDDKNEQNSQSPTLANDNKSTPFIDKPKNKGKKKIFVLVSVIILLLAGVVLAYLFLLQKPQDNKPVNTDSSDNNPSVYLQSSEVPGSENNKSGQAYAYGFVKYEPAKLSSVSSNVVGLDTLEPVIVKDTTDLTGVFFTESYEVPYDSSLLMYDFKTKKTYIVTETTDNLVRHYYNPTILSNHYVAFYEFTYKDPVTPEGSVAVVDLLTGEKKTIIQDKAGDLPSDLCCSVSPNGLYLAIPKPPNKVVFFTAGGDKVQELEVPSVSFLPKIEEGTGDNKLLGGGDYAKAQLASMAKYPQPKWLDNNRLVLANSPPKSYVGATSKEANNGLSILDVSSGRVTPINDTKDLSIDWFGVADNTVLLTSRLINYQPTGNSDIDIEALAAKLLKVDLVSSLGNKPEEIKINDSSIGALGDYVVDRSSNKLFIYRAGDIISIDIKDDSMKLYQNISIKNVPLIGVLDGNIMIFGADGLAEETSGRLEAYDLATSKSTQVYYQKTTQ